MDMNDHWTMRLLAQKAVELEFVKSISPNTIHEIAQKNELKPWQHEHWCLPAVGGEFVAAMEDVLDLYEEEYDPQYPTVCLDEKPVVLHADVQPPVPVEPGKPERVDYEYERKGTRNLFVMVEPRAGFRHVEVTEQRTMQDYAKVVRWLVDEIYPQAEYIRLVQDNLNTHTPAALYETFPPAQARRILQRVEFHYTRHPWQLVEYGRDRDRHSPARCSVSTSGKRGGAAPSGHGSRNRAEHAAAQDCLAVHLARCPSQAGAALSGEGTRSELTR